MYFFNFFILSQKLSYLQKTCQSALGPNVVSQSNLGDSEKENHFPPCSRWKGSMKNHPKKRACSQLWLPYVLNVLQKEFNIRVLSSTKFHHQNSSPQLRFSHAFWAFFLLLMPSTISPTLFDWELDSNPTGALNWKVSETNNGSGSGPTDNSLVRET